MGLECSNLYQQIIGSNDPRSRIKEFISKNNQVPSNFSNIMQSQSLMLKSLNIELYQKCQFIQKISKQQLREGNKQILSYQKTNQDKILIKFKDGSLYKGHVQNKMRSREGEQKWVDGTRFIGNWKENLPHGKGVLISPKGFMFQGHWEYGLAEGQGKYYGLNGTYQGSWSRNQPSGFGIQTWNDGSMYQGYYLKGKKYGQGTYKWPDQSIYKGFWYEGKIQGKGKYMYKDGKIYQGDFLNNMMHGQGIYNWPDGRKYVGQYKKDKKQGYGRYYWPDGRYYEGQWVNGKRNGYGKIVYPSGIVKYGLWDQDKKIQQTTYQNIDKDGKSILIKNEDQKNQQSYITFKRNQTLNNRRSKIFDKNFSSAQKSTVKVPLYASSISPFNNLKKYYDQHINVKNKNKIYSDKIIQRYDFINSPLKQDNYLSITRNNSMNEYEGKYISNTSVNNRISLNYSSVDRKKQNLIFLQTKINKNKTNFKIKNNTYKKLSQGKPNKNYKQIHLKDKIKQFHEQKF